MILHTDRDAVELAGEGYPFNNSIHIYLEDGADADDQSDGCVRWATLNDLTAESTGGLFDAYGKNYYFSVQHNVTGHGVILKVTGWNQSSHAAPKRSETFSPHRGNPAAVCCLFKPGHRTASGKHLCRHKKVKAVFVPA